MKIQEHVKHLIATTGDGLQTAVHHLAGELDSLKESGLPAPDLEKIATAFDEKVNAFLNDIRQSIGQQANDIEKRVEALEAAITRPAPPAIEPGPLTTAASQGQGEPGMSNPQTPAPEAQA